MSISLNELASSINRLGPEKGRLIDIRLLDGTTVSGSSVAVVGQLLQLITDPSKPRDSYILINPSGVLAYLAGSEA